MKPPALPTSPEFVHFLQRLKCIQKISRAAGSSTSTAIRALLDTHTYVTQRLMRTKGDPIQFAKNLAHLRLRDEKEGDCTLSHLSLYHETGTTGDDM